MTTSKQGCRKILAITLGSNKKMVQKNGASLMSFCEDVFCWLYGVPPVAFLFGKYSLEKRLVLNFFVLGG